jgi:hypothetical protein
VDPSITLVTSARNAAGMMHVDTYVSLFDGADLKGTVHVVDLGASIPNIEGFESTGTWLVRALRNIIAAIEDSELSGSYVPTAQLKAKALKHKSS